jgi:hypothetical protein
MRNEAENFYIAITGAADRNDVENFKSIMVGSTFSNINQVEKEKTAFRVAYASSEVCLDYLIFEYNIPQNDIIEAFCGINEIVKKKFEIREIALDMPINPNKRIKVKV